MVRVAARGVVAEMRHVSVAVLGHCVGPENHANGEVVCIHLLVAVLSDLNVAFVIRLVRVNPAAGFASNFLLCLEAGPQFRGFGQGELVHRA